MEFVVISVLVLVAAFAAFGLMLGGVAGLQFSRSLREGLMPYWFYAVLASSAITILLSGRNFDSDSSQAVGAGSAGIAVWALRITSIVSLLAAADQMVRYFQRNPRIEAGRVILVLAMFYCWLVNVPIPAHFAANPLGLQVNYFYAPFVLTGLMVLSASGSWSAVRASRNAIVLLCAISLLLVPILPGKVVDFDYSQGYLPGVPRLAGLTPHAIALGMTASVGVWCLLAAPYANRWMHRFAFTVTLAALFFAQSKTVWASFLLLTPFMLYFQGRFSGFSLRNIQQANALYLVIPLGMLLLALVGTFYLSTGGLDKIHAFMDSKEGAQIMSFTGRDKIWEIALREWQNSPITGYGLGLFSYDYRVHIRMLNATSGHNQFIDALGRTGLLGFSGYVLLIGVVLYHGLKFGKMTRGLSVVLSLSILLRTVTEETVSMVGVSATNMPFYLLVAVIAGCYAQRSRAQRDVSAAHAHAGGDASLVGLPGRA